MIQQSLISNVNLVLTNITLESYKLQPNSMVGVLEIVSMLVFQELQELTGMLLSNVSMLELLLLHLKTLCHSNSKLPLVINLGLMLLV